MDRGDGRDSAREEKGTTRRKLWLLVGDVHTYGRADRGGLQSDGRGSGIGDPAWNLQYMEW